MSAEPGIGTAIPARAWIRNRLFTSTSSPRSCTRGGTGANGSPAQPEIERWMHYVADRLDLRKDIQFNTTIKSAHFDEATDRWTITTDKGQVIDAQFPGHLLRHVVRAAHVPVPGTGDVQGAVVPHRALAEGPGRFRRQARRRGRHRRHGDPGHSDHCGQGRPPDGVRPHAAIHNTDEEPEIHARRSGGVQVGVQPVRSASAAHIQRLCVRFREPVGRADAGAARAPCWRRSGRTVR